MDPNAHIDTENISFGYNCTEYASPEYDLHCHNFYEVYLFLEGNVDYLVEGQQYKPTPNSMLLLSPHVFHGVRINDSTPYRRFSIHFHPDILSSDRRSLLLSAFPSPERRAERIYFEQVERFHIPDYFEALEDCARKPPELSASLLPICVEALLARITSLAADGAPLEEQPGTPDTATAILLYLNRHLKDAITLDQLSEQFFISKHHLNKVFRKATGTTVFDYLLHKRVILAQQLLIDGYSAQAAASEAGFGDYSSFYRAYKRILGHSPLKDRGVLPSLHARPQKGLMYVELKV